MPSSNARKAAGPSGCPGGAGRFGLAAVTEFGAEIEDPDNDGISIVHIATGIERYYRTDPRPTGEGFTGQKISLGTTRVFCSDAVTGTLYASCEGFEYARLELEGLRMGLPFVTFDTDLRFELEDKAFTLTPTVALGEIACVDLYGAVDWDATSMAISGLKLSGIELICELGSVVFRDVALFDLSEYILTTERFGSRVMEIDDALEAGCDFYPDYWELMSIAVTVDACCGESFSFLANAYFDKASSSLFDWAMLHIEASVPLALHVGFTLGMETKSSGTNYIAFGISVDW